MVDQDKIATEFLSLQHTTMDNFKNKEEKRLPAFQSGLTETDGDANSVKVIVYP